VGGRGGGWPLNGCVGGGDEAGARAHVVLLLLVYHLVLLVVVLVWVWVLLAEELVLRWRVLLAGWLVQG